MSQTISLDQLPRKAERLLRKAWEGRESILLERNGELVAAVVPRDDYRRLHPEFPKTENERRKVETTAELPASTLTYELPTDLMADYDRLLNKKFDEGLTPEEETEFARLAKALSDADMETPLGQAIMAQAQEKHERWMRTLNEVVAKLRELRESL